MLKNYLKVALRSFRQGRMYAFVNIFGLALGMATCALIFLLVYHEWSYDRFHEHAESIHRVYLEYEQPDGAKGYQAMMTPDFTPSFKEAFPQIQYATRYVGNQIDIEAGDDTYRLDAKEIDPDFFEMFSFEILAGDAVRAIQNPSSMVITAETAATMFGVGAGAWDEALGRTITITGGGLSLDFSVDAIVDNFPDNSSLDFDVALSFENYDPVQLGGNNWGGRTSTYVKLAAGTSRTDFESALVSYADQAFGSYVQSMQGASAIAEGELTDVAQIKLQPLDELHSNTEVWLPYEASAHNPMYSWILLGIGTLILLIACINFMTLSVGRSTGRAREVGVRKVLGAFRSQIMKQYWGESFATAGIALIIGLIGAIAILPWFSDLVGTNLSIATLSPLLIMFSLLGLVLVVGLVAGGYPAIVLSRFQPAGVLKGNITAPGSTLLTRLLVIVQFTISIGLIVSMGVMTQQLRFLLNKDLGFEDEFVVAVEARQIPRDEQDNVLELFKEELVGSSGVVEVSRAGYTFTRGSDRNTWTDANGITRSAYNFGAGYDYIDVMGMEIVEGRNFSREYPSDPTSSVLVNEALVEEFGLDNPVGQPLSNWLSSIYEESPTIIGVVKDFHFQSLHSDVQPAVLNMHPDYYNYMGAIVVRVRPDQIQESLANIEQVWNRVQPGRPYNYYFVEEDLARQYAAESRWQDIVTYASVLAILIACMGLFGLALLTVSRRTKEIGIRKVLGASASGIARLLSKDFAFLVITASLLAAPLAWFAMTSWLQNFAFHTEIGPGVFLVASLSALVIALATVSVHAVRAARLDPVESLRYE